MNNFIPEQPDVVGEPHDSVRAPRGLVEVHPLRVALDVGDADGGAQKRRARRLHLPTVRRRVHVAVPHHHEHVLNL